MTSPRRLGAIAVLVVASAVPLVTANTYYLFLAMLIGITIVLTTGLNILAGWSGQVSLGQAGFYALGAYAGAICAQRLGLGFWTSLPLAAALGAAVGLILALASLRVSGPYLAMVTIAFGIIVEHGLIEWTAVTQGFGGIGDIPRPRLGVWPLTLSRYYWIVLAAVVASLWLARNLQRSAWGRAFVAVRDSEVAAESIGLNPYWIRTVAFTLSAAFAGVAGCLYAFLAGFVSPDSFTMQTSIVFLLIVLFGGLGHVMGPVVGSLVLIVLPEVLHEFSDYRLVIYGLLLLGSIYFLPEGVVGALTRRRRRPDPAPPLAPPAAIPALAGPSHDALPPPILTARELSMRFGGVVALDGAGLELDAGGVHGLIGPNGAGKTTLLNLLSGFYRGTSGRITLGARSIHGFSADRMARAGIARTFQTTQLFDTMSVVENVEVGLVGGALGSLALALVRSRAAGPHERDLRAEALALLDHVGHRGDPDELARNLPFGHKRLVEIARALARRPKVLLLDEPAAGLSAEEIEALGHLIARIRRGGIAVLLVGHHMDLVMGASDRVTVLNHGRVIAEGSPAEVQQNRAVLEAYLGSVDGATVERPRERSASRQPAYVLEEAAAREQDHPSAAPPRGADLVLEVSGVAAAYDRMEVLHGVSFEVGRGQVVALIGANGAGKTTTLRAIAGLVALRRGAIRLDGAEIGGRRAHRIARLGVAMVPEGRMVFPDQTVLDNLRLGAYGRRDRHVTGDIERQLARFPALQERRRQLAGTLSGGEQQMLAIARGLMARPRLLLLDEPSLGLAPRLVGEVFEALATLRDEGLTLLVVEQMAEVALGISDRAYVLEHGRIVLSGAAKTLLHDERVARAYLGRTR